MTFKEIAPFVIATTLMFSILIAIKVKKKDILSKDGIFSIMGFGLGLFITSMNLKYSNNYLISLGPLLAITSLLYLRFRTKILTPSSDFNLNFSTKTLKIINILYWVCISIALISYHQAPPYYRPPIFFFSISIGATLLGLEILASKFKDNFNVYIIISKILFISLILRASAYFISPYLIGGDPWAHAEYIKYFLQFHHVMVPYDHLYYYVNYPIAHLLAVISNLIGNISIKESMFNISAVLALSTIFAYLIVKKITNNINLALLAMLLLNFAEFHIQWSIEVIAMTFGIAIYTIIIYLILKKQDKHPVIYTSLLILFLFVIIWTHTISGFIAFFSVICLYVGSFVYHAIYRADRHKVLRVSLTICKIFIVIMLFHWMDLNYPFFNMITNALLNSLTIKAEFLGRTPEITQQPWVSLLNILGFLVYIFFGIIGSLYVLSRKYADQTKVSLVFMLIVLYSVFFVFPLFGLNNIVPYRWPPFIFVSFVLFVAIGFTGLLTLIKSKNQKVGFVLIVLFITFFFMITNSFVNMDSSIYGKEINQKRAFTESEMTLFENMNNSYVSVIVTDEVTANTVFSNYLKRSEFTDYQLTPNGDIDWNYMNNKLFIWRKISLTRPVQAKGYEMLLGTEFKNHLDENFGCIYDTGGARAYFGKS